MYSIDIPKINQYTRDRAGCLLCLQLQSNVTFDVQRRAVSEG
jgi:hypothetical protein